MSKKSKLITVLTITPQNSMVMSQLETSGIKSMISMNGNQFGSKASTKKESRPKLS